MSFIRFIEGPPKPKTRTWRVVPVDGNAADIGYVGWYAPWRCYSFFPGEYTVFERRCLRDIADFCEAQTKERRASRAV